MKEGFDFWNYRHNVTKGSQFRNWRMSIDHAGLVYRALRFWDREALGVVTLEEMDRYGSFVDMCSTFEKFLALAAIRTRIYEDVTA